MDGTMLQGDWGTDRVCPTADTGSCATDFKFVVIDVADGLASYEDGIIGLWSGNTASADKSVMIVPEMVRTNAIAAKAFSFHLSGLTG